MSDARSKAQAEHDRMITNAREEVVKLASEAAEKIIDGQADMYADLQEASAEKELRANEWIHRQDIQCKGVKRRAAG